MENTILGIILMLTSTTAMNIGNVIQKKAVDRLPAMEETGLGDNVKGVVKNKLWILGWILTTTAMVLNMIALGQADMSITQPLTGFGLVVLVIFSYYYLGEKVNSNEIIGIIVAIIGVIILGIFAEESREFTSMEEITGSYMQINAWIIFALLSALIAGLWIYTVKAKYKGAGIIFAFIAATFSVMGLTFSKGAFSIPSLLGYGVALTKWQTYVFLLCFITCSTMAISLQQLSFQKGKSVVVTPIFNLVSIILPFATGAMVFSEVIGIWKIVGTIFIFVGVVLLSLKKDVKETEILEDSSKISN